MTGKVINPHHVGRQFVFSVQYQSRSTSIKLDELHALKSVPHLDDRYVSTLPPGQQEAKEPPHIDPRYPHGVGQSLCGGHEGLAVAVIVSLAHGENPCKIKYDQDQMRFHLIKMLQGQ